jgi:hypothetical protein
MIGNIRLMAQWLANRSSLPRLSKASFCPSGPAPLPQVFVMVEGPNDIEFLHRMSTLLHAAETELPDLAMMERQGKLIVVPVGGGEAQLWTFRLAGIGVPEFHLYDRDVPPQTEIRRRIVKRINGRLNCIAFLTGKRAMENYLHPDTIFEVSGLRVAYSDQDDVAQAIARAGYRENNSRIPWEAVPPRARRRRLHKIKKWLNTQAVERMTLERLTQQDPGGEVLSWLMIIGRLASGHL